MSMDRPDVLSEQMLRRICAEYVEMPGLRLSRKQAQRLRPARAQLSRSAGPAMKEAG